MLSFYLTIVDARSAGAVVARLLRILSENENARSRILYSCLIVDESGNAIRRCWRVVNYLKVDYALISRIFYARVT